MLQGRNYPAGIGGSQVRLVLLPSKKQRRKTRVRQGSSPQYMESFLLPRVNPEDVNAMGLRVRVYLWGGRMRRERLLGEARVSFDRINLRLETTLWLALQPPPSSSVSFYVFARVRAFEGENMSVKVDATAFFPAGTAGGVGLCLYDYLMDREGDLLVYMLGKLSAVFEVDKVYIF